MTKYEENPFGKNVKIGKKIKDFLPPPEELVMKQPYNLEEPYDLEKDIENIFKQTTEIWASIHKIAYPAHDIIRFILKASYASKNYKAKQAEIAFLKGNNAGYEAKIKELKKRILKDRYGAE